MGLRDIRRITRRTLLKAAAAAGILGSGATGRARGGEPPPWAKPVLGYLEGLARPDGGYGWSDQPDSHLTATFAAVGAYHVLGQAPPRKDAAAQYVLAHHPIRGEHAETKVHAADLRTFVFQQIQTLLWLGADASSFRAEAAGWTKPSPYPTRYEQAGNPIFRQEMLAFVCRPLLGIPLASVSPELIKYLAERRRPNGSFNNTPAADGSDGHILNTWWGLEALAVLGRTSEAREPAAQWLRSCQLPCGGFTYQPKPPYAGIDDATYTWAAVRALAALGAAPADREACVRYLWSLGNEDGGFGDRPGLPSDPMATYRALDALDALGALRAGPAPASRPRAAHRAEPLPENLKVFTVQIEAPGQGSPSAAVELARALKIHLWGAKNADPAWVTRVQDIARQRGVPVTVFVANEEYNTYVNVPGLGDYSHVADLMAPAGIDFGPSQAGKKIDWPAFRQGRIAPLERAGGRIFWQICDNEEFARILLDDSVERGGYAGISTFHFGCWNMAYTLPFVFRYRHLIPLVALQDAHGIEPWWWADNLAGFRTVFLAAEPTFAGWLEALKRQRVVAVRHDAVTQFHTRMLGGGPGVQDFLRAREAEWKWWGDRPEDIRRPGLSLAVVGPEDRFEVGRPEKGAAVCVRTWWQCGNLGNLKQPVVELANLQIDGRTVAARLVEKKNPKGQVIDRYHRFDIPAPAPGRHTVAATGRRLDTGDRCTETIEFSVP
jgi:prenyltransferase beta subunit